VEVLLMPANFAILRSTLRFCATSSRVVHMHSA
jgi:hypothetical protein